MENYYNIHNILRIKISDVDKKVVDSVDGSLRYFKVPHETGPIDIDIKDISLFFLPNKYWIIRKNVFGFGNGFYDKQGSLAARINNKKLEIFCKDCIPIETLMEFFLLDKDFTLIHGGGISYKDTGIIFTAPSGTGKTSLLSILMKKSHIKFFGDDKIIINKEGMMFSYPKDFAFRAHHFKFFPELEHSNEKKKIKRKIYEKFVYDIIKDWQIKKIVKKIASFVGYDFLKGGENLAIPAQRLIPPDLFGEKVRIKHHVFFNEYNGNDPRIEKLSALSAIKEMITIKERMSIQQMDFKKISTPFFHPLSCLNFPDVSDYISGSKSVISGASKNVNFYRIFIPTRMAPEEKFDYLEKFFEDNIFKND